MLRNRLILLSAVLAMLAVGAFFFQADHDPEFKSSQAKLGFPAVVFPVSDQPFPEPPESTPFTQGPKPHAGPDAMLWLWSRINWPYGPSLPAEVLQSITVGNSLRLDESDFFPNKSLDPWQPVGGIGMDLRGGDGVRYSGRITDIRTYPGGGIRVSTPNGGLFHKVGGGWVQLAGDFPVLGIGSFDIHPTDPNTMIAGTGEHARGGGSGFMRTTDGGITWDNLGAIARWVFQVRYEPASWGTNTVHAATGSGHISSFSGGDPATWFTRKSTICTALAFDPSVPGLMYSGYSSLGGVTDPGDLEKPMRGGLFRSTDFGITWLRINDPALPDSSAFSRVSLEVCTNQPQTVYALASDLTVTPVGATNEVTQRVQYLFRSNDRGLTWDSITIPADIDESQGWYNQLLAVNPDDPDMVLIGGVKLYRTDDGGATWAPISVHADQHTAMWVPGGGDQVLVGNDGGLYNSADDGQTFTTDWNNLPITQYVEIDVCGVDPGFIVGGAQDNGLTRTVDLVNWEVFLGGDGGGITLRPADCDFGVSIGGAFSGAKKWKRNYTENGFVSWSDVESGIDPNNVWYPAVRWPAWADIPYTTTEDNVYRNTDIQNEPWEKLNATPFDFPIRDMTTDELGEAVYVILGSGEVGERIQVFQDGIWQDRDLGDLPDDTVVRKIKPHPSSGMHGDAHLLMANASTVGSGNLVYKTNDFGVTWTDISGNIGPVVPTDIIGHPTDPNQIYVGTNLGLLWTPNGGTDWFNANTGMPDATTIMDLYVVPDLLGSLGDYWLYAGTFSNGIYRRRISSDESGAPVAANSIAVGAGEAHPDSSYFSMLAHPDGSGQTPLDAGARILVQILDVNSVPVAGVDGDRITLHPFGPDASACGYFTIPDVTADYDTDSAGWTQFRSKAVPWGGYASQVEVRLDGIPLRAPVDFRVASTDMTGDNRVDLLDMREYWEATKTSGVSYRADLIGDRVNDEADEAVLMAAMNEPKNCPFEAPVLEDPDGQLGLYFDSAGNDFGRIVFSGGEFDLYVIAKDLNNHMRGVEFQIQNLDHPAVEILSVYWMQSMGSPHYEEGNQFRGIFQSVQGTGDVPILRVRCRLKTGTHVPFRLLPVDGPTFGTPSLPGVPGYIGISDPALRYPFAEFTEAAVNPFPLALYNGLQYQVLGSAALVAQLHTVVFEGLDSGPGGGAHFYFENAHVPGSKSNPRPETTVEKGAPAGVDGAALMFGTTLSSANTQASSTVKLSMYDGTNNTVLDYLGSRAGGLWSNTLTMPALGAQTYRLQLRNQGLTVLDDPAFSGTFDTELFLPQVFAVVLADGEIHVDQNFGQSFLVVVGGNQYQADQIEISSQTQGSATGGMLSSGSLEGYLLPDIVMTDVGVQRYGQFFRQARNTILASETDRFRCLLVEADQPGSVIVNSLFGDPVGLTLVRPQLSEIAAALDLDFSDGDDPKVGLSFTNGPTIHLTANLDALGGNGWSVTGSLGGVQQWEVMGSGPDLADVNLWPGEVSIGPAGPLVSWPVPVQLTGLAGAGPMVDTIEIKPLVPVLPMPFGGQLDVSFSGMAQAAFTDASALSAVQPIPVLNTSLLPNVPNPFNPATEIRFTLADPAHVKLAIYDLRGRLVRTLLDGNQPAGPGAVRWNGQTDAGAGVAAGVYHALMRTPSGIFTRKLVLVK